MSFRDRQLEKLLSVRRQIQGALNTLGKKIAAEDLPNRTVEEELIRTDAALLLSRIDQRIHAEGAQSVRARVEAWEAKDHSAPPATEPGSSESDTVDPASTATTDACAA